MAEEAQEKVTAATREAERRDAQVRAGAPEEPTPDEEAAAERAGAVPTGTPAHYREMVERGAGQKGEGRLP